MESVGIVKEIDNIGRIVVPADIRKTLGLYGEIELVVTKEGLLIRNPKYKLVER